MAMPELTPEQKQKINDMYTAQMKRDAENAAKKAGRSVWQKIKAFFRGKL